MEAYILVRRDGRDSAVRRPRFVSQVRVLLFFQISLFARKSKTDTSVQNLIFMIGLWETAWGKMSVTTVGSFQFFIKRVTLTRALQVKFMLSQKP